MVHGLPKLCIEVVVNIQILFKLNETGRNFFWEWVQLRPCLVFSSNLINIFNYYISGKQIFEKMVSGMYMGELIRQVLVDLMRDDLIFFNCNRDKILERGSFYTRLNMFLAVKASTSRSQLILAPKLPSQEPTINVHFVLKLGNYKTIRVCLLSRRPDLILPNFCNLFKKPALSSIGLQLSLLHLVKNIRG